MSEYLNEQIGYNVQGTAEWRRRKAEEFPDDTRNLQAAEELERIANEIETLDEGCPIHKQIEEAEEFLNNTIETCDGDPAEFLRRNCRSGLRGTSVYRVPQQPFRYFTPRMVSRPFAGEGTRVS